MEETERATVGGVSDREKEQEESAKKPNAFVAVGDESGKEKASAVSEETERGTVGGESDREYRDAECI